MQKYVFIGSNVPLFVKYAELLPKISDFLAFPGFNQWKTKIAKEQQKKGFEIKSITIQDVDYFKDRVGFAKFSVDMVHLGVKLPGIVFCRGASVAVLVVVESDKEMFVVCTRQARVAVAQMGYLELPAGMMDGSGNFRLQATKELEEECGISIEPHELCFLNSLAPSPGACDEYVDVYYAKVYKTCQEIEEMQGRKGGLAEDGEDITLDLVRFEDVYQSSSMTAIAALSLYKKLSK